jgi:hypothetical protein
MDKKTQDNSEDQIFKSEWSCPNDAKRKTRKKRRLFVRRLTIQHEEQYHAKTLYNATDTQHNQMVHTIKKKTR